METQTPEFIGIEGGKYRFPSNRPELIATFSQICQIIDDVLIVADLGLEDFVEPVRKGKVAATRKAAIYLITEKICPHHTVTGSYFKGERSEGDEDMIVHGINHSTVISTIRYIGYSKKELSQRREVDYRARAALEIISTIESRDLDAPLTPIRFTDDDKMIVYKRTLPIVTKQRKPKENKKQLGATLDFLGLKDDEYIRQSLELFSKEDFEKATVIIKSVCEVSEMLDGSKMTVYNLNSIGKEAITVSARKAVIYLIHKQTALTDEKIGAFFLSKRTPGRELGMSGLSITTTCKQIDTAFKDLELSRHIYDERDKIACEIIEYLQKPADERETQIFRSPKGKHINRVNRKAEIVSPEVLFTVVEKIEIPVSKLSAPDCIFFAFKTIKKISKESLTSTDPKKYFEDYQEMLIGLIKKFSPEFAQKDFENLFPYHTKSMIDELYQNYLQTSLADQNSVSSQEEYDYVILYRSKLREIESEVVRLLR